MSKTGPGVGEGQWQRSEEVIMLTVKRKLGVLTSCRPELRAKDKKSSEMKPFKKVASSRWLSARKQFKVQPKVQARLTKKVQMRSKKTVQKTTQKHTDTEEEEEETSSIDTFYTTGWLSESDLF